MAADRFAFGKNWKRYVEKHFDQERVDISKAHLLSFLGAADLKGKSFLDIGCGSGLHSLAAFQSGATRVIGFDYDQDSVDTTKMLRGIAGNPENWSVTQGSVLDRAFMETLPEADIVYSWGVLHHTGDQWNAIRNAASKVAPGGIFYIALYTSDVFVDPTPQFWLDIKQRYVRSGWAGKRGLELWYIWRFMLNRNPFRIFGLLRSLPKYRFSRGMSFYTDVMDWLGGWPMEFSSIAEVKTFATDELNMEIVKVKGGEANTEYLFRRRS